MKTPKKINLVHLGIILGMAALLFVSGMRILGAAAPNPADAANGVSAVVVESPPSITLHWGLPTTTTGLSYSIYRKALTDTSWGTPIATNLAGDTTSYTDTNVVVGKDYEYQIVRNDGVPTCTPIYGYIYSGIDVPAIESHGYVILLVDSTQSAGLAAQLTQLQSDLVGDGWVVLRHDIDPTLTVPAVKAIIQNDYTSNVGVNALLMIGHIPVPYSGTFACMYTGANPKPTGSMAPDGHNDHSGAWPADVYYGDMTGTYTDVVDTTVPPANAPPGAPKPVFRNPLNSNIPGDGKFDQDHVAGTVVLQIGRVDLSNLTYDAVKNPSGSFTQSETALLQNYLNKDHNYRFNNPPFNTVPVRALVGANYSTNDRPYLNALMTIPVFCGQNGFDAGTNTYWLPSPLSTKSYLWAFGQCVGTWQNVNGADRTADDATNTRNAVFTGLEGSYSGDWNYPNDVVRAVIASNGTSLACAWGVQLYYHHMALGQTLGYGIQVTQNNGGLYPSPFGTAFSSLFLRAVMIAQHGDPTLRLFPVLPPSNPTATVTGSSLNVAWTESTDSPLRGYYVYRSASPNGPFTRLSPGLVSGAQFVDSAPLKGVNYYMVRAIKFQTTNSGTYLNPSQGVFANASLSTPSAPANQPPSPSRNAAAQPTSLPAPPEAPVPAAAPTPPPTPVDTAIIKAAPLESYGPDGLMTGVSQATVGQHYKCLRIEKGKAVLQDANGNAFKIQADAIKPTPNN